MQGGTCTTRHFPRVPNNDTASTIIPWMKRLTWKLNNNIPSGRTFRNGRPILAVPEVVGCVISREVRTFWRRLRHTTTDSIKQFYWREQGQVQPLRWRVYHFKKQNRNPRCGNACINLKALFFLSVFTVMVSVCCPLSWVPSLSARIRRHGGMFMINTGMLWRQRSKERNLEGYWNLTNGKSFAFGRL